MRRERGQRTAPHFLEFLGQFAGDRRFTGPERFGHVGQRGRETVGAFKKNQR